MITIAACARGACTGDWYHGYQDINVQYTTVGSSHGADVLVIGGSITDTTKAMG
jgi:hypothetical protein